MGFRADNRRSTVLSSKGFCAYWKPTMSGLFRKIELRKSSRAADRVPLDEWGYPSGMVWCPMKMSGMALMKCAEMQKQLGCGSLRQFKLTSVSKSANVPFFWPWLKRTRECSHRADDKQVRELRLELTPLKLIDKTRKNLCPACGGRKAFGSRRCRSCWRDSVVK